MSIYAKKTLGQHFLRSERAIADIVSAGEVVRTDTILEIGPGEGVLTEALLHTGATVFAIEMDDRCIPILNQRFEKEIQAKRFILLHGDVRDEALLYKLFSPSMIGEKKYKLIANIPYYITGLLFRMFLETTAPVRQPTCMVYLIQKEVADELVGKHGKLGNLALAAKLYGDPLIISKVPKGAFVPPPKVDSAIITIKGISKKHVKNFQEKTYFAVVHAGLANRRKMLLSNLHSHLEIKRSVLEEIFSHLDLDTKIRGEDLPFPLWVKLAEQIERIKK